MTNRSILTLCLVAVLAWFSPAWACTSAGRTEKDRHIASLLCQRMADLPDVRRFTVDGTIMSVEITEWFYRVMYKDRVKGNQAVRRLVKVFQQLREEPYVTVRFVWDGSPVVTGDVKIFDDIRITYADD